MRVGSNKLQQVLPQEKVGAFGVVVDEWKRALSEANTTNLSPEAGVRTSCVCVGCTGKCRRPTISETDTALATTTFVGSPMTPYRRDAETQAVLDVVVAHRNHVEPSHKRVFVPPAPLSFSLRQAEEHDTYQGRVVSVALR